VLLVSVGCFPGHLNNLLVRILLKNCKFAAGGGHRLRNHQLRALRQCGDPAVSAPGLALQKLTTRRPDAAQIEVAIASMKPCIPRTRRKMSGEKNFRPYPDAKGQGGPAPRNSRV
jgi:uncharacterized protein YqhQ